MRVKNKVAVVTGSAQGMGKAFALRLAKEGAKVTLCDILDCEPAAQEIAAAGGEALALKIDVTNEQNTAEMAKRTAEYFGSIDILVNNAAIFGGIDMKPFEEIPANEWEKIIAVNLKGMFLVSKYVIQAMSKSGGGSIINMKVLDLESRLNVWRGGKVGRF